MSEQSRLFEDTGSLDDSRPRRRKDPPTVWYYIISINALLMPTTDPYDGKVAWIPRDPDSPRVMLYNDLRVAQKEAHRLGAQCVQYDGTRWL